MFQLNDKVTDLYKQNIGFTFEFESLLHIYEAKKIINFYF